MEEIFEYMDQDGDGLISAQSINISGLNQEVLKILTPLLEEME